MPPGPKKPQPLKATSNTNTKRAPPRAPSTILIPLLMRETSLCRSIDSIMCWVRRPLQFLCSHSGQDAVAGTLATATGRGAHPAMLHVLRMLLALLTTESASVGTGLQRHSRQFRLRRRLARKNTPGGKADIGTVQVQPNAANQPLYVLLLTKAGVCTSGTGLGAVEAGLDALHQRVCIQRTLARVRLDHFSSVGHGY